MLDGYSDPPRGPRVVLAPDAFRGSLTATEVVDRLAAGLSSARPDAQVVHCPVADGGEGTLDAALSAGFRRHPVRATGPTGRPVESAVAVRDGVAVVEMADACGLIRVGSARLNPLGASSRGAGDLVRAALDAGCHKIVLAVGGSASTDGGAGMLQALGARLLDADGIAVSPGGVGLGQLTRVDVSTLDPRLRTTKIVLASDVDNPLLGPDGAASVYGPQKGASEADVKVLERALTRWADQVDPGAAQLPGAGAAGGVGFAAMAVLGARMRPGIEVVLDIVGLRDVVEGADLVVTGEGRLDSQTLRGKAVAGVAAVGRAFSVPVVAVCGERRLDDAGVAALGLRRVYALTDLEPAVERSVADAGVLVQRVGQRIAADWLP
ncbi:MAG TPA: glycerate kinase [Actinomycetales bacterium]|nr:glycerate kinase [Actinomycetales bacterium]